MSKPKLTPWFPGSVRPARPGVYLASVLMNTDLDDSRGLYRYWNGKHWCKPAQTPDGALEPTLLRRAFFRITYWRGRANAPRTRGVDLPHGGEVRGPGPEQIGGPVGMEGKTNG